MKTQSAIPQSLRDELSAGCKKRWESKTPEERKAFGRMLWQARVRKHQRATAGGEVG